MLYLSFKFVRKFKFCVSPLVKRYLGLYVATSKLNVVFVLNNSISQSDKV